MNLQFLRSLVYCNSLAILVWIMLMLAFLLFRKKEHGNRPPISPALLLCLCLYFASIISITLVPLPFSTHRKASPQDLNFVPVLNSVRIFLYPFKHHRMALLPDILENIFGNVLMFIPLGMLLPLVHHRFGRWRRTIAVGLLFSVAIETSQWIWRHFGNYRHVDVDDVLLNTFGTVIGIGLFKLAGRIFSFQKGTAQAASLQKDRVISRN